LQLLPVTAPSQSVQVVPPSRVRGEMPVLTADLIVVKSADGTNILIPLKKETTMVSALEVGDRVESIVVSGNQANSIKKLP
jgi:hypothetical protein